MRAMDPSDRNFEIFCDVEHGGLSLRAAAKRYELSPTRIQQIVEQVRNWYQATLPAWVAEASPQTQPMLGCRMLQDRLQYLYQQAMDSWRASQGEQAVRRDGRGGGTATTVTTNSFGQVRYLGQAMRIAEASCAATVRQAKIRERLKIGLAAAEVTGPPQEVCAREEGVVAVEEQAVAVEEAATASEVTTYEVPVPALSPVDALEMPVSNPVRSRLAKKLARHEKRKAARARKRVQQSA